MPDLSLSAKKAFVESNKAKFGKFKAFFGVENCIHDDFDGLCD